jgi:Asp-tRNA(Asn)/Glu-tRNA(Gln) amidotransferase A subunit family amidase
MWKRTAERLAAQDCADRSRLRHDQFLRLPRKLSPLEVAEAYLSRIAALGHLLDIFVTLTAARARADARAAKAAIMASGPV